MDNPNKLNTEIVDLLVASTHVKNLSKRINNLTLSIPFNRGETFEQFKHRYDSVDIIGEYEQQKDLINSKILVLSAILYSGEETHVFNIKEFKDFILENSYKLLKEIDDAERKADNSPAEGRGGPSIGRPWFTAAKGGKRRKSLRKKSNKRKSKKNKKNYFY
jgi:hypothetical protein